MRRIGVNAWVGIDPFIAHRLNEFEKWTTQSRNAEQERLSRLTPSERFLRLANQRFRKPKLFGIAPAEDFWQVGDWTMVELRKVALDDAKDSGQFLIHLQSLYVVDSARGKGEGKKSIEQIKQIADECGCGVTLFAKSFAFSKEGRLPNALQTFEELRRSSLEEKWPVIYLPEWDIDCLRFFYEGCGFHNMCLYDSWVYKRPKEEDLPFKSQFVYLPVSMEPEWRSQIANRLNPELCKFCNR